jgi:hypothetical protein
MAPNIDDLIMSIEIEEEQTKKRVARASSEMTTILAKAKNEGRATLTMEEDEDIEQAFKTQERAKAELKGIAGKLEKARRIKTQEESNDFALLERHADPATADSRKPAYDRVARVGQEERTYNPRFDRSGGKFLQDVTQQFLYRSLEAEQRLSRHMQEERVERGQYLQRAAGDANTGAFAGLTVPQYLTDMYAPKVAALRPFADQCNHHDLPANGMTINISLITTGTSVGLQATELAAASATSIDDTLLTENVQTASGQQLLSRQAIDRGTGVEDVVMDDLFRRYATMLDSTLINQATTGLAAQGTTQSYTAAATGPGTYSQLIAGASTVESILLGWAQPDLVVMHPRRWYSLLSAVTASWPMIAGSFTGAPPVNATGIAEGTGYAKGLRGRLANGLGVCVDANVTTTALAAALTGGTQDQIYVVPTQECHLWEDPNAPVFIRAEQPAAANLGVLLVLYGYFAYTFRRFPGSIVNINGAALVPPTFSGS